MKAIPYFQLKLVHCGARADTGDEAGWTPLHEACNSNNEAAVEIFISTGVNLDLTTRKFETALHIATRRNHTGIVARLLAAGA